MPTPDNKEGSPSVGSKVSPAVKKRIQEIAHERTVPGEKTVRESDVVRDALQLYIDFYNAEEGPTAEPENATIGRMRGGQ